MVAGNSKRYVTLHGVYTSVSKRLHPAFKFSTFPFTGIYHELIRLSETHTNPAIMWWGPTLVMMISSAEDMQAVLTSPHCLQKAYVYNLIHDNNGIFYSKGMKKRIFWSIEKYSKTYAFLSFRLLFARDVRCTKVWLASCG